MLLFTSSPSQVSRDPSREWRRNGFSWKWPHFVGCPALLVIWSFFCCFPSMAFVGFSVFHYFCSITSTEFIFIHDQEMWALHVLLLCHISRPVPRSPLNQPSRGGIPNCKDINMASTTTIPHTQAHFSHPILFHSLFHRSQRFSFYEVLWWHNFWVELIKMY